MCASEERYGGLLECLDPMTKLRNHSLKFCRGRPMTHAASRVPL